LSGVRWWLHAGAGLLALGGMTLYGRWRLVTPMTQAPISMRIGLVQPMLQAHRHRSSRDKYFALRTLQRLTRIAEDRGAELVIWPEAAYPYPLPHGASQAPGGERQILAAGIRGPLLFGAVTESAGSRYNSALTLARNGILSPPQPKLRPLWFGEAVPMADTFPSLARLSPRAIRAGRDAVLQRAGAARMGVLNCYEDTLPDTARRIAMAGPNLLVNVTNDAWFEGTRESELHLLLSVMRAVESRLDLVRAVNGGAAAWVDATGRIRARGTAEGESALLVTPALREHSPTWFVRFGNAPLLLAMLGLAAYLALRAVLQNGTAKPIGPKVECPPPDDSPAQRPAANTSLRG